MLIIKPLRAPFPRRSLVQTQPVSAVPGTLPRGSVYPARNKLDRFDPVTRCKTHERGWGLVPCNSRAAGEPQTPGWLHTGVCLSHGRADESWQHQGETWSSRQQEALCLQSCPFTLNSDSRRGKLTPNIPLNCFFQPHVPKEAKKSHLKHIQGLKVMMRATAMQRVYIYLYEETSFFPVTCNLEIEQDCGEEHTLSPFLCMCSSH